MIIVILGKSNPAILRWIGHAMHLLHEEQNPEGVHTIETYSEVAAASVALEQLSSTRQPTPDDYHGKEDSHILLVNHSGMIPQYLTSLCDHIITTVDCK